jgi:DNA replication protein
MSFKGFRAGKVHLTPIPGPFFHELLPQIDSLDELKVCLYAFWRLDHQEGQYRYLRRSYFLQDTAFLQGLATSPTATDPAVAEAALDEALERCVQRGFLLKATIVLEGGEEAFYFLNSPKGREALRAIGRGDWRPSGDALAPLDFNLELPNIFALYEENIGPLTPLIAERLRLAEETYPAAWVTEAVEIAVENNKRSWRYIETILRRWQEEGRDERKDRRDAEKDRRRYVEGEFADYIEH